jgi:hypothetical protein
MKSMIFVLLLISASVSFAGIIGREISYTSDTLTMKGYIAYDSSIEGKQPGIIVVHEWWGHNARRARLRGPRGGHVRQRETGTASR